MWKNNMNSEEVAGVIERFLEEKSSYFMEWNNFVDTTQDDEIIDSYRERCYELDPIFEEHFHAVKELRAMVEYLRKTQDPKKLCIKKEKKATRNYVSIMMIWLLFAVVFAVTIILMDMSCTIR
ncbi:MAG: hypothetical protein AB7S81_04645 [Bdellovibrionales bacterium]